MLFSFCVVPCPEIIDAPLNSTVLPGEMANFDCLAYSHGSLKYKWTEKTSNKMFKPNTIQGNNVSYTIDTTQPSDEGWYCCVATNECGDVEECAWLEVDSELYEELLLLYTVIYFIFSYSCNCNKSKICCG